MPLHHLIKRAAFASCPLFLSLAAATQPGCSSDPATGTAGGPPTSTMTTPGGPPPDTEVDLLGFKGSKSCEECHTTHYAEWEGSMHAHSLTSPVMIAQTKQVFAADLIMRGSPDPQRFCVNCHSPVSTLFADQSTLPFKAPESGRATSEALKEGIGCISCHSYTGTPSDSRASVSDFQDDFTPGTTYYGPIEDPLTSPFHDGTARPLFQNGAEGLCLNCHNVKNDRNEDFKFTLGTDLILQTTFDEYNLDYRVNGGQSTCLDCHMAEKSEPAKAAPGYPDAPLRTVHDHRFVGVDYPLDEVAKGIDPQKEGRRDLLTALLSDEQGPAATLELKSVVFDGTHLSFNVAITNTNAGHNLPTGFAFMRQMWVEVVVRDRQGTRLNQSGQLQDPTSDLCDNDTLTDLLNAFVSGCANNKPDPQLVNFQAKLVDAVTLLNGVLVKDPVKGHETWLPFQASGVVPRKRPVDQKSLAPIQPFQTRTFGYSFTLPLQSEPISLSVALKFRNLPPYFVRKLAQSDSTVTGGLKGLLTASSFQVLTMAQQFLRQAPVPPSP